MNWTSVRASGRQTQVTRWVSTVGAGSVMSSESTPGFPPKRKRERGRPSARSMERSSEARGGRGSTVLKQEAVPAGGPVLKKGATKNQQSKQVFVKSAAGSSGVQPWGKRGVASRMVVFSGPGRCQGRGYGT